MGGKLFSYLLMVLAAIVAWKWLRRGGNTQPPATRPRQQGQGDANAGATRRQGEERVIELERDADGVYRPRDE